jgi:microcystin-dependent protein
MAQSFLGEITPVAFNFAPRGWALCNGQILQINQNQALFSLLGTTYGGDGIRTFALPDLRGRVIIHSGESGAGYNIGQVGGFETVTLNVSQMPAHSHQPRCVTGTGSSAEPAGTLWAGSNTSDTLYQTGTPTVSAMFNGIISQNGASQPHSNLQPYLVVNFIIALSGVFPSRN